MDTSHLPGRRVVAFLEILGFRELVRRMEGDEHTYALVAHALHKIREERVYADRTRARMPRVAANAHVPGWDGDLQIAQFVYLDRGGLRRYAALTYVHILYYPSVRRSTSARSGAGGSTQATAPSLLDG